MVYLRAVFRFYDWLLTKFGKPLMVIWIIFLLMDIGMQVMIAHMITVLENDCKVQPQQLEQQDR
jgi:hypothetical protein